MPMLIVSIFQKELIALKNIPDGGTDQESPRMIGPNTFLVPINESANSYGTKIKKITKAPFHVFLLDPGATWASHPHNEEMNAWLTKNIRFPDGIIPAWLG